jgi:hypothetical protein
MASILCSSGHRHVSVDDVKRCYGIGSAPGNVPSTPLLDPISGNPRPARGATVTQPQIDYIANLGGDPLAASRMSRKQASDNITMLQRLAKAKERSMTHTPPQRSASTKVVVAMIDRLGDGYYAWTPTDDSAVTFLRVKRHKDTAKNQFAGSLTVQTQHSDTLMWAWQLRPDGRVSRFRNGQRNFDIEDIINGLIVDPRTAQIRYSRLKGNCCICNKDLTDPRSRHYGVGPECEKSHGDIIADVDEANDGQPYEALVRA